MVLVYRGMASDPIMISGYPRAIIHMDADAFFTSVEQALDDRLKGRPVVTGKERGIIACASYEAKRLGIKRGIPLFKARTMCPELVILPSDYETYSLYSKRMFDIMRQFTPMVEEYSVDEAFADLTGMRGLHRASYEEIAQRIQQQIHRELGFTVSIGLSLTKALAKLGSKFRKPNGFTGIRGRHIHLLLERTPLEAVWGFGPNTVSLLEKHGLRHAYDFVCRNERWVSGMLHKPGRELWNELRGNSLWKVTTEEKTTYATILKSKTFTPASHDRDYVYAKLVRNVELAFMKARRHHLRTRMIGVVLRHQDFGHDGLEAKLNRPTASTLEVMPLVQKLFERMFNDRVDYRATMIVLGGLENDRSEQYELFEDRLRIEDLHQATLAVDAINQRYGKHTVGAATSLFLDHKPLSSRDERPEREQQLLQGESKRRHLAIPRLKVAV